MLTGIFAPFCQPNQVAITFWSSRFRSPAEQARPAHLRLGGEGEPGGEAGQQDPGLGERPVRAVQRRAGLDRDHDRLAGRAGEADQGEVDVPLLPAGAERARAQREQLDRGRHLPSRETRTGAVRTKLDRRRGALSRREQPARSLRPKGLMGQGSDTALERPPSAHPKVAEDGMRPTGDGFTQIVVMDNPASRAARCRPVRRRASRCKR
jgi:hypothetical protein